MHPNWVTVASSPCPPNPPPAPPARSPLSQLGFPAAHPTACAPCALAASLAASPHGPGTGRALRGQGHPSAPTVPVGMGTTWPQLPPEDIGERGGHTVGSHRTAGGPGAARRRRHPGAGRTSSSSGARGCSGAGAGGLRAERVMLGDRVGTGEGREGTAGCWWHSQNKSMSRMASLAWGEEDGEMRVKLGCSQPLLAMPGRGPRCQHGARCPPHCLHLLGDDGVVVLQDEPLDVVGPQALLLHALGLAGGTGRVVGSGRGGP